MNLDNRADTDKNDKPLLLVSEEQRKQDSIHDRPGLTGDAPVQAAARSQHSCTQKAGRGLFSCLARRGTSMGFTPRLPASRREVSSSPNPDHALG